MTPLKGSWRTPRGGRFFLGASFPSGVSFSALRIPTGGLSATGGGGATRGPSGASMFQLSNLAFGTPDKPMSHGIAYSSVRGVEKKIYNRFLG